MQNIKPLISLAASKHIKLSQSEPIAIEKDSKMTSVVQKIIPLQNKTIY